MNQLSDHPTSMEYFWPDRPVSHIEDDHIPFLSRGATLVTVLPRSCVGSSLTVLLCRSGRCSSPPPHSYPLPYRVAHVWRQRAEPGPLLHWEPQQDPADLRAGIPQCQAHRAYKPADVTLETHTCRAKSLFNRHLHNSKWLSLLTNVYLLSNKCIDDVDCRVNLSSSESLNVFCVVFTRV